MSTKEKILSYETRIPSLFIRFYLVGLVLYMIPFTRNFFISITSLSLLFVISIVFLFHKDWNIKSIVWFLFIVCSSFFLEMAGIQSGKIFGEYSYDRGLAPLINGTPLIIGFNWLFLVYASQSIVQKVNRLNPLTRILSASLLMILYDILLEWVAPFMRMWHFESGFAPFQNFLVWFIASLIYHAGFEILHIKAKNLPARSLFVFQMIFFLVIGIYSQLFIL
ncbi:MAG: carotenoid biosynthesis protein [Bacteroidales bacterium]|nr:carotenoid biosynthesis protein [Bacteroidales bacterium]